MQPVERFPSTSISIGEPCYGNRKGSAFRGSPSASPGARIYTAYAPSWCGVSRGLAFVTRRDAERLQILLEQARGHCRGFQSRQFGVREGVEPDAGGGEIWNRKREDLQGLSAATRVGKGEWARRRRIFSWDRGLRLEAQRGIGWEPTLWRATYGHLRSARR